MDPSLNSGVDIGNIVNNNKSFKGQAPLGCKGKEVISERPNSEDFIDDDSVPPLM